MCICCLLEHNPPDAVARFFGRVHDPTATKPATSMRWSKATNRRHADLAWLKAAYMIAFAHMGYPYVLTPAGRLIRDQLARRDEPLIKEFMVRYRGNPPRYRLMMRIDDPPEWTCLLVQFGNFAVFLPDQMDATFYSRFADAPPANGTPLYGNRMLWPTHPLHSSEAAAGAFALAKLD